MSAGRERRSARLGRLGEWLGRRSEGGGSLSAWAERLSALRGVEAVDATRVYWVDLQGNVLGAPIGGRAVTTLATGQDSPEAIAVDSTGVYWMNNGNGSPGSIMKLPFE